MSNIDKLIQKMKQQPNGIRFQEIAKVLEYNRIHNEIKKGTSHRNFINSSGDVITIKGGNYMKSVKEYMDLPYNYIIQPIKDESGLYYHAKVLELDGCQSTGETFEEAYNNLKEAMEFWLETKLEAGFEVPLPVGYENYSGKFIVRIPKSLHYKLAIEAQQEGISLNQYALYKLSK